MEKDAVKSLSLVKVYQGKGWVEALKGVDLSIGKGELFTLLGPNDAGKTTFLRVISTQLVQIQNPKACAGFGIHLNSY